MQGIPSDGKSIPNYKNAQMLNHNEVGASVVLSIMQHLNIVGAKASHNTKSSACSCFNGFRAGYGKAMKAVSFIETYNLKQGIIKFGNRGKAAAMKEMRQLHNRDVFRPIDPNTMTPSEQKKLLESLIFITEKRDGTVKAQTCANGSVQRKWMDEDDSSSPTVLLEATFLTAAIDAYEGREAITVDFPNAFVQTPIPDKDTDGDQIIRAIRGALVDILVEPHICKDKVVYENGKKFLYLHVKRAIYGMPQSGLMHYQKFRKDVEEYGFIINPYDPCAANKMVYGKQLTVTWHVDNLKASHKEKKVLDQFAKWLQKKYGSKENPVKDSLCNDYGFLL